MPWLQDGEVQRFLQINRYRGVLWFNKEAWSELLRRMLLIGAVELTAAPDQAPSKVAHAVLACYEVILELKRAEEKSGYQVLPLMEAAKG